MAASYAEAASSENKSKNDDYKIGNVKPIFLLKQTSLVIMLERLRIDNLLTNCRTGDRIVICKPFNPTLPKSLQIGKYLATINHFGQSFTNRSNMKCSKCFEEGHSANTCSNGWKCRKCGQLGHKQYECNEHSDGEYDEDDTYMTNMDDVGNQDVPNASENDEHNKDCTDISDKSFQESEVYSQHQDKPLVNTEDKSRSDSDRNIRN
ncbi:unnamed protein product [Mytilus coruscus]|uniref:CCHC-type domain-containing protein n=1 Tax=Mytilus coruscus TaxID=42192 RepID=A0A6J8EK25_MYTCO|nr:unnamed protein product [Mytilus coruscus]